MKSAYYYNLNKIPLSAIDRAEKVFLLKAELIPDSPGCLRWPLRGFSFQTGGSNGTVNQWLLLFKYKRFDKNIFLTPYVCGNRICVNKHHLIAKKYESDLSKYEDSPYFNVVSTLSPSISYGYQHIKDVPSKLAKELPGYLKSICTVNDKGCWIYKNTSNHIRYKNYGATPAQFVAFVKYGFYIENSRIHIERPQCQNVNCMNPEHIYSPVYDQEMKNRLNGSNFDITINSEKIESKPMKENVITENVPKAEGFHSESLAKAVYNLSQASTAILDQLDNCSDDIRKLESFLEENSLATVYDIDIDLKLKSKENWYQLVKLAWGPHNAGKFRVMIHFKLNDSQQIEMMPLLQMPAMVRLKGAGFLDRLVEHIVESM